MALRGMDVEEVERLVGQLEFQANAINAVVGVVDTVVGTLTSVWFGADLQRFHGTWQGNQRAQANAAAVDIDHTLTLLRRELADQRHTSRASTGGRVASSDPALGNKAGTYEPITNEISLDDKAFVVSNMRQGAIGDCWFVAPAMAIGSNDPDWIRDHIRHNPDGSYTVTLYDESGKPVPVTVTASVASNGVTDGLGNPSWVSIYEKAAAQQLGGYDNLEGGDPAHAYRMITGGGTTVVDDPSIDNLRSGLASGTTYIAASHYDGDWWNPFGRADSRIVPNHAYIIDKVEWRDGRNMVHLVNPWGDYCAVWQGDDVADLWMSESDFHHNFSTITGSSSTKG